MYPISRHSHIKGIELKDHTCQPAKLEIVSVDRDAGTSLVQITIAEGKFHQVKRMVAACGKEVTELQRMSMGPLSLPDDLELGAWRRLTEEELEALAVLEFLWLKLVKSCEMGRFLLLLL